MVYVARNVQLDIIKAIEFLKHYKIPKILDF